MFLRLFPFTGEGTKEVGLKVTGTMDDGNNTLLLGQGTNLERAPESINEKIYHAEESRSHKD